MSSGQVEHGSSDDHRPERSYHIGSQQFYHRAAYRVARHILGNQGGILNAHLHGRLDSRCKGIAEISDPQVDGDLVLQRDVPIHFLHDHGENACRVPRRGDLIEALDTGDHVQHRDQEIEQGCKHHRLKGPFFPLGRSDKRFMIQCTQAVYMEDAVGVRLHIQDRTDLLCGGLQRAEA